MIDTSTATRLAHLHLRAGLPVLALVELEALAAAGESGTDALGIAALADLAEARWRAGALVAAGEAAQAHLDRGGDDPVAQVVAVEAMAAAGRHRDARQLAMQVVKRRDVDQARLEAIFAGRTPSAVWPVASSRGATRGSGAAAGEAGREPAPVGPGRIPDAVGPGGPIVPSAPSAPVGPGRPLTGLTGAEAALARGDLAAAAAQLALALREEPVLAPMVLSVAERALAASAAAVPGPAGTAATTTALLQLVRGDALRLLGRASEASAAFQGSRRALTSAAPREDTP